MKPNSTGLGYISLNDSICKCRYIADMSDLLYTIFYNSFVKYIYIFCVFFPAVHIVYGMKSTCNHIFVMNCGRVGYINQSFVSVLLSYCI